MTKIKSKDNFYGKERKHNKIVQDKLDINKFNLFYIWVLKEEINEFNLFFIWVSVNKIHILINYKYIYMG